MATLSRFAFLNALAIGGAFVLTGCGGSTDKNSNYTGAYRSAYTISSLDEVGTFNFTVDVKGNISGLMDNQTGKVREVSGQMDREGTFNASTRDRGSSVVIGRITGTMSIAPTTIPIGTDVIATPVIGGNFSLVESGATRAVNFVVNAPIANSTFQAAYTSNSDIVFDPVSFGGASQTTLADTSTLQFSVDRQGVVLGTVGQYRIDAQIKNDNLISGTITDNDGTKYSFTGIASKVIYNYQKTQTTGTGATATTTTVDATFPGIYFQLVYVINGKEYNGFIKAVGGTASSTPTTGA